jgi:hypothetical protein
MRPDLAKLQYNMWAGKGIDMTGWENPNETNILSFMQ